MRCSKGMIVLRRFLSPFLVLCLSVLVHAEAARPNIIFILVDDMGWSDLHCYGHPYAKTPNVDRLAAEGTRFQQFYATGVTCCPSRTGFMSSKLPATFAKYPANGGFGDKTTITALLHAQGYATGHFGKWHIGPDEKAGTYGIDVVGADDGEGAAGKKRDDPRGRDAHIYDQAISFIEKHKEGPFYVNIWDHIPHHPVNPVKEVVEAFGPLQVDESKFAPEMQEKFAACRKQGGDVSEHMRNWLADIRSMDQEVGRLLQRLGELGLMENTIIAFSSDQGPAPIRDKSEDSAKSKKREKRQKKAGADEAYIRRNAMGYPGPYRGGKFRQYEGGVRIPFIVRWPGHVPAGRVDENSVLSGADWLPSLCAITGTKINAADFDGEDSSKAWLGGEFTRTKPLLWKTSAPNSEGAIRDGKWKLHHPNSRRGELELYDITADPGEHHNLASEKLEIVKALSAKLEAWQATLPKSYEKATDGDK